MGRLGKECFPWFLLWAGLALASCGGAVQARERYAGPVSVTAGRCAFSGADGAAMNGTLLVSGTEVQFVPDEGIIVLRGQIDANGHVMASATTAGADHKPFLMVFEGDLHAGHVDGRYATPRCRATVSLARAG